ncbi:SCF ubiquitin ligase complex subunit cdc4 [Coemansia spiralis]|uniref:SCF ubiquitin ligase complex subunit cdc4 n=2 Tax=Coemansia TaxID=4863 RepID=A0A9W8G2L6_9FUNG|nr:hypothetical protein BX070DRAFT_237443 [Coemansia spiralis]KAJ1991745.1 SCF ubiquitin ligase complex subunit cdc4 [Coemansia umbellata]KAJ2621750.1 SCF ubiquitin ligase complex subunit cdc4 [Coemansia sp. RSA 1358]KAJ2677504.1 SCF ubiquitin ligase complex subunit cdc4 [Coemansia spiralis]
MDYHLVRDTAAVAEPQQQPQPQPLGTQQEQLMSAASQSQLPLPSPQEAAHPKSPAHAGKALMYGDAHGFQPTSQASRQSTMLSAQTVTTTTVTTTTVTTFPPLRIPKASRKRALAPEQYPLADVPVPTALEHFAMDLNGQRMYFSQRDFDACMSGEEILASISANTANVESPLPVSAESAMASIDHIGAHAFADASQGLQRAITPLYTHDDATTAVRRHISLATPSASAGAPMAASSLPSALAVRAGSRTVDDRSRRSSSPHSPDNFRHYSRGAYSPSPPMHRRHQQRAREHGSRGNHINNAHSENAPVSTDILSNIEASAAAASIAAMAGAEPVGQAQDANESNGLNMNEADDMAALDDPAAVLPLPSPLLSPRARPESMDTDMTDDLSDNGSADEHEPTLALAGGAHSGQHVFARRQLRFTRNHHHHHQQGYRGKGSGNGSYSPPMSSRQSAAFDAPDGVAHFAGAHGHMDYMSDTDDIEYGSPTSAGEMRQRSSTMRTSHVVSRQRMSKDMVAMYDMPSIMATYDNLPPSMQTYLLHQLLRRTPRPALQFAAQTVLPVLNRDFIGELPSEVSHHVLKFMDTRVLCRASCVSRKWQDVINADRSVWRSRLLDARYVTDAPRVHPLCYTYFGLGAEEPARSVVSHRPVRAELDLANLARRTMSPRTSALVEQATRKLLLPNESEIKWREPSPITTNEFKDEFVRNYTLDRNWHTGKCRQFSFVCDGGTVVTCVQLTEKYIVAGFDTKNIYVFDINTGETVRQLVGHDGGVWALAVIGSTVVSGSTDRTVRVWDLDTGRCTHVFAGHSSTVRCLQILLPTDVRTPLERARNAPVRYEPKEPLIVTGSRDTTLRVWRLPSPTRDVWFAPRGGVTPRSNSSQATLIPTTPVPPPSFDNAAQDNRMAVDQGSDEASNASDNGAEASGAPGTARSRNGSHDVFAHLREGPDSGITFRAHNTPRANGAETSSAPGTSRNRNSSHEMFAHLREGSDSGITVRANNTPRVNPYFVRTLEGHSDSVRAVAGHGNLAVSGSYDCTIRVWDLATGACLHRLEGHTSKVYTIVLDPDMHLILSGSMDGTIRVWDWDTGACLRICRGHLTLVGLLALQHGTLVSAGADTTLRIWDHPIKSVQLANATVSKQRPFSNIRGDVIPTGNTLQPVGTLPPLHTTTAQQAGNLQQVHFLQQLQLQQRANDQLHQQQLLLLQQQHQQQQNGAIELRDMVHTERHVLQQHTNAITCFQHDGTKIVSGADTTLKLWDVRTGQFVRDLLSNLRSVWQVKFDKRRCVAAVDRNNVTYFEVMDFGA